MTRTTFPKTALVSLPVGILALVKAAADPQMTKPAG